MILRFRGLFLFFLWFLVLFQVGDRLFEACNLGFQLHDLIFMLHGVLFFSCKFVKLIFNDFLFDCFCFIELALQRLNIVFELLIFFLKLAYLWWLLFLNILHLLACLLELIIKLVDFLLLLSIVCGSSLVFILLSLQLFYLFLCICKLFCKLIILLLLILHLSNFSCICTALFTF